MNTLIIKKWKKKTNKQEIILFLKFGSEEKNMVE